MSYESPEERIERLENKVERLTLLIMAMADNIRQNHKGFLEMVAFLADQDRNLAAIDLNNLKTIFEQSKGFDEPFRQAMLKNIDNLQKQNAGLPGAIEELKKMAGPVLPEDLFGPDHQWPPQNPPDKPPGSS